MKKIPTYCLLLVSLFIFISACNNEKAVYESLDWQFKISLDSVTNSQKLQAPVYMVIPRAGCGGCISTAEVYMIECLKDPDHHKYIKFILTNFDSEKLLRARFGEFYKSHMLIIDKNSAFAANNSLKSIYPTIYFFNKEARLINVSQCSPSEAGTDEIKVFADKNPQLVRQWEQN